MAEAFDPYHTWLGIPAEEQPPNHYRLLAVSLFEDQPEAIENAADQRMAHLRTLQVGAHGLLSERLLNEVASARVCLLNAEKKLAYDNQLRLRADLPVAPPPALAHAAAPAGAGPAGSEETADWTGLRQLGVYRLLDKLGAGGMGEVFKAIHTEMDRVVAVKVLAPNLLKDEHAVARFKREIKAVASLNHPNIVQAHDAREIDGTRFLVMEYVEGLDLRDLTKRLGSLPVPDACELVRRAALGLQCAHEHGLVHRDIKPGNLMLGARGDVKVLDLGLARLQIGQSDDEITGTGQAMGTADYMAPEQATDSRSVDIRADIYSLGCTLYRLIANHPPFDGPKYDTPVKKLMGHVRDPVRPIRRYISDVPVPLEIVLDRLLAKEPSKRLDTPAQVAEALEPFCVGANLTALHASATGKIPRPPMPGQAEVATQQSSQSSGLTQFLDNVQQHDVPAPPEHAPTTAPKPKMPRWLGFAAIGGTAMLLVGLVWGIWSATHAPEIPPSNVDQPVATQTESESDRSPTSPSKSTLGRLILRWSADERTDAMLQIDDKRHDPAELVNPDDPQSLRVDLQPGVHKVWIVRRGFQPFEQSVTLDATKSTTIVPKWNQQAGEDTLDQPEPLPIDKLAVPDDAVLQPLVERIDDFYHTADANLPTDKTALARKMLDAGKIKEEAAERFVLRRRAMDLAVEAGDVTLAQEAVTALATDFQIDADQWQRTALARIEQAKESAAEAARLAEEAAAVAEVERRRRAEWVEGTQAAEDLVAAWDFTGATAALEQVAFDDAALTDRLARRRDEVDRMGQMKARIIRKLNAFDGQLTKRDLMLRGLGGTIIGADDKGISSEQSSGHTESLAWSELNDKGRAKLLEMVVNRTEPEDWLSAGILAFSCGDTELAERLFSQAVKQGVDIGPYLAPMAESLFAEASDHLAQNDFAAATAALDSLTSKYGNTPWVTTHHQAIAAVRTTAKTGLDEFEAEKLYAEAVELFAEKELFDLKPLVDRLQSHYPTSTAVTDTARTPTLAEMAEATSDLGRRFTVRLDGKGDFKGIQEAIDGAPPNSQIEIQDDGPYLEKVRVRNEKRGLTIRGARGCWPIVSLLGTDEILASHNLVSIEAPETSLERLILLHATPEDRDVRCLSVLSSPFRLRSSIVAIPISRQGCYLAARASIADCIVLSMLEVIGQADFDNCLLVGGEVDIGAGGPGVPSMFRACTVSGRVTCSRDSTFIDSIVSQVSLSRHRPGTENIVYCDVFAKVPFVGAAKPGKGCLSATPQFVNPGMLDYRLQPTSPCKGRATDGGDLGVRYTPEMVELCKIVLQLRARGIIKF